MDYKRAVTCMNTDFVVVDQLKPSFDPAEFEDTFNAIRDDSVKIQFYSDIQLLCEEFLEETLLLDNPPLMKCRTHYKSLYAEICDLFENNYKVVSYSLEQQQDEDYVSDDDLSVC